MSRVSSWTRFIRSERRAAIEVLGSGYALLLLGATASATTVTWIQDLGVPAFSTGLALLAVGAVQYSAYWHRRGRWSSSAQVLDERDYSRIHAAGEHRQYRPNYGPGKLPRPGDVDEVVRYAREKIPAALFYTEDLLQQYIDVNPGALRCIRTDRNHPLAITGYYVLLALSKRGEALIRDGSIDVGVALPPALTVENPRDSNGLYIGMYHAMEPAWTGPDITLALTEHIDQIVNENERPMNLYARSGNLSSRGMMDKLGFAPLNGGEIGSSLEATTIEATTIEARDLDRQIERLRRIQMYRTRT